MKSGIHPEYHVITVTCACGETFVARSTSKELRLEICSKCHPFFTGKQKLIDSAGRVERFEKRYKGVAARTAPEKKPAPAAPPKAASRPASAKASAKAGPAKEKASGGKGPAAARGEPTGTGDPAGSGQS